MTWDDMKWWDCGERQVVTERLNDLQKAGRYFNPARRDIFKIMKLLEPDDVKVAIFGQDPYPTSAHATGIAFSVPSETKIFPPTLDNFLQEYSKDLHYPYPHSGDLTPWVEQGVFLWNVIPTVERGLPKSHNWTEYQTLNKEVIEILNDCGIVYILLGGTAREYKSFINTEKNRLLEYSHPSPRGSMRSNKPFIGSRLFTAANAKLHELGKQPIDWRLE